MRPLQLEIGGFRSYAEPTTIDFEGRSLMAIVGPIGSGKSSILDAISFALYGKTSRVQSGTKRLISTRAPAARIHLTFSVDGAKYEIVRSLPRQGNGEHLLVDLSSGDKTIGAHEVSAKVEELLGLGFDAFGSSILLAQGRFSKFLEAGTTDRTKILKGVFRLDRMSDLKTAAKQRESEFALELAGIEGALGEIPADAAEQAATMREQAKDLNKVGDSITKALPEEKRLQKELTEAEAGAEDARKSLARLTEAGRKLAAEAALDQLCTRQDTLTGRVDAADKDLADAEKAAADAAKALADLESKQGSRIELRDASNWVERRGELTVEIGDLDARVAAESKAIEGLRRDAAQAEEAEAATVAALEAARIAVREAHDAHRAHALRAHLTAGDPCPVCEQVVAKVPKGKAPATVATIEKQETAADKACTKAREGAERARSAVKQAEKVLEHAMAQIAKERKELTSLDERLATVLGAVSDPAAELARRVARLDEASTAVDQTGRALVDAKKVRDSLKDEADTLASDCRRHAADLIAIAERIGIEAPEIDVTAGELRDLSATARATLDEAITAGNDAIEKLSRAAEEARVALASLRTGLHLPAETGLEVGLAAIKTEVRQLNDQSDALEKQIARSKDLRDQAKTLTARKALFTQLADDMRDTKFLDFLLEDRRRLLSELGSQRLREMTGRYRFSDDAKFDVIDEMDGDQRRDHETLSGGETFLASLALALALAEAVTREGGRLQCFFLDEGFGSLDAEAFDLALDGIEKIVTTDRLIGLVSHVPALSARIEDKVILARNAEGTTEVVAGASG
jgi:DNA repair protein SbcC/Rad50